MTVPERGDPFADPPAGEREAQQRQGRTEGEGQRQRHRVEPDGAGRPRHDDGCQDRTGARHVEHPQCQAQPETASAGAELLLREPGERPLQKGLEPWEDQPEADGHQGYQCEPADGVLR